MTEKSFWTAPPTGEIPAAPPPIGGSAGTHPLDPKIAEMKRLLAKMDAADAKMAKRLTRMFGIVTACAIIVGFSLFSLGVTIGKWMAQ